MKGIPETGFLLAIVLFCPYQYSKSGLLFE